MAHQVKTPDQGLVYIFTGDGKGKTSAALGVMLRGLSHGWRVGWISWYKEASWGISEHAFSNLLTLVAKKRLQFFPMGKGFFLKDRRETDKIKTAKVNEAVVVDDDAPETHKAAAHEALEKATELLRNVDVLILDEVCNAISDGLLEEKAVLALLKTRGPKHIILTGRNASATLKKAADLVSSITKEKHPFDSGHNAVKGLDF